MNTFRIHYTYQSQRQHYDVEASNPTEARNRFMAKFEGSETRPIVLKTKVVRG